MEVLSVSNNRLTGTVPWQIWDRSKHGHLSFYRVGNTLSGVGPPPFRSPPVFSGSAAQNGNASHHSVAIYQGPLTWEWDWRDDPVEHQQPLLGRWAALAVRVDHEVETPPIVLTRVLNNRDSVLAEKLDDAALPVTQSLGDGKWRTEYVFHLPGALYQAGNQVVHVIDPDNDLAETNERRQR